MRVSHALHAPIHQHARTHRMSDHTGVANSLKIVFAQRLVEDGAELAPTERVRRCPQSHGDVHELRRLQKPEAQRAYAGRGVGRRRRLGI